MTERDVAATPQEFGVEHRLTLDVVGLGSNQGGGWFYEERGLGTAPLSSDKARELHDEWRSLIYGR